MGKYTNPPTLEALSLCMVVPPKTKSFSLALTTAALLTPSLKGAIMVHLLMRGSYRST